MATTVTPNCACPKDSEYQLLAKINNNLVNLFSSMSGGLFKGQFVNLGPCLCSQSQILAAMNNNIVNAFSLLIGGASIDPTIQSWSDLAAVATTSLSAPQIKIWVDSAAGVLRATQLLAGTDATDTASGIQRPNDYDPVLNAKVWYNKLV